MSNQSINDKYTYIEFNGELKSSKDLLEKLKEKAENKGLISFSIYEVFYNIHKKEMADFDSRKEYDEYFENFNNKSNNIIKEIILELKEENYKCYPEDIYSNINVYLEKEYMSLEFENEEIYKEEFRQAKQKKIEEERKIKEDELMQQKIIRQDKIINSAVLYICLAIAIGLCVLWGADFWTTIIVVVVVLIAFSGVAKPLETFSKDMARYKYGDKVDNMTLYEINQLDKQNEIINQLDKKLK